MILKLNPLLSCLACHVKILQTQEWRQSKKKKGRLTINKLSHELKKRKYYRLLANVIIAKYVHNTYQTFAYQEEKLWKFFRYQLSGPFAETKTKMIRSASFVTKLIDEIKTGIN